MCGCQLTLTKPSLRDSWVLHIYGMSSIYLDKPRIQGDLVAEVTKVRQSKDVHLSCSAFP